LTHLTHRGNYERIRFSLPFPLRPLGDPPPAQSFTCPVRAPLFAGFLGRSSQAHTTPYRLFSGLRIIAPPLARAKRKKNSPSKVPVPAAADDGMGVALDSATRYCTICIFGTVLVLALGTGASALGGKGTSTVLEYSGTALWNGVQCYTFRFW